MDPSTITGWVDQYVRAWESNDPGDIRKLFTKDAAYFTSPFAAPWRGHEDIVRGWLGRQDAPGNSTFRYEVLASAGDLAIVRGWTRYLNPPSEYSNIWLVRLDAQGRCREFAEWWMQRTAE